jgi:hypothetical protein
VGHSFAWEVTVFLATVLRIDDSVLAEDVTVHAKNSKRGDHTGLVWRGIYSIPMTKLRPTLGETIHLRVDDNSLIAAVVTEVEANRVHFRARGRAPHYSPLREAVTESTQPCGSGR